MVQRFSTSSRSLFPVVAIHIRSMLISGLPAFAQGGATGAIQGTVRDSTGAAVSAASVKVVELTTGLVRNQQVWGSNPHSST